MQTEADGFTPEILAALVKRQTHDLRNALNGIEFDLALLTEATNEAERLAASRRIRQQLRCTEETIRSFAPKFIRESKTLVCVADVVHQWNSDVQILLPEFSVQWELQTGDFSFRAEAKLLRSMLSDLVIMAARRSLSKPVVAGCRCESDRVTFSIASNDDSTDTKGASNHEFPFQALLQGLATRCGGTLEVHQSKGNGRSDWRLRFAVTSS